MPTQRYFVITRLENDTISFLADEERWYKWVAQPRQAKHFLTFSAAQAWMPSNLLDKCQVCESTYD